MRGEEIRVRPTSGEAMDGGRGRARSIAESCAWRRGVFMTWRRWKFLMRMVILRWWEPEHGGVGKSAS